MLSTIGLSIVYYKILTISTYVPLVMLNYKYDMINFDNIKILKYGKDKFANSHPKLFSFFCSVYSESANFGEKSASFLITQLDKHTKINFNICPKRLTNSIIKSSVMYKFMIPVYLYSSYKLAEITLSEKPSNIKNT